MNGTGSIALRAVDQDSIITGVDTMNLEPMESFRFCLRCLEAL